MLKIKVIYDTSTLKEETLHKDYNTFFSDYPKGDTIQISPHIPDIVKYEYQAFMYECIQKMIDEHSKKVDGLNTWMNFKLKRKRTPSKKSVEKRFDKIASKAGFTILDSPNEIDTSEIASAAAYRTPPFEGPDKSHIAEGKGLKDWLIKKNIEHNIAKLSSGGSEVIFVSKDRKLRESVIKAFPDIMGFKSTEGAIKHLLIRVEGVEKEIASKIEKSAKPAIEKFLRTTPNFFGDAIKDSGIDTNLDTVIDYFTEPLLKKVDPVSGVYHWESTAINTDTHSNLDGTSLTQDTVSLPINWSSNPNEKGEHTELSVISADKPKAERIELRTTFNPIKVDDGTKVRSCELCNDPLSLFHYSEKCTKCINKEFLIYTPKQCSECEADLSILTSSGDKCYSCQFMSTINVG